MKVMEIHDQLVAVGDKVEDKKLVNWALNGFPSQWETFVQGVCARDILPSWERLWDDCIYEETRMESKASKQGGGINYALFGQTKKGRGKGPSKGKGKSDESTSQSGKKDLSKIKCFICHKHGHYV